MVETARGELWRALGSTGALLSAVTGFLLWVSIDGPSPVSLEAARAVVPDWTRSIVYALLGGVLLLGVIVAWAMVAPPSRPTTA